MHLSKHLSKHLSIYRSKYLSKHLFKHLSRYLPKNPSKHLSRNLSKYLPKQSLLVGPTLAYDAFDNACVVPPQTECACPKVECTDPRIEMYGSQNRSVRIPKQERVYPEIGTCIPKIAPFGICPPRRSSAASRVRLPRAAS